MVASLGAQDIIEYGWTFASLFAVLMSIWTIPRARMVYRDVKADAYAMRRAGEGNGRRSFAEQQWREGRLLLVAHWFALLHQSMFFSVGVWALLEPNPKINPGAPLLEEVGVPVVLLIAQYLIVVLQIALALVTSEQRAWRHQSLQHRKT
jgi:hypothetical protein